MKIVGGKSTIIKELLAILIKKEIIVAEEVNRIQELTTEVLCL